MNHGEDCPECGADFEKVEWTCVLGEAAECQECGWIEDVATEEDVDEILDKVGDGKALRLESAHDSLNDSYLIRENGVIVQVSNHGDYWSKTLYSHLSGSYRLWIKKIMNDQNSYLHCDFEFIDREKVPETRPSCIGKYCQGTDRYSCSRCGDKVDDGLNFAIHAWNAHGITQDPRQFRNPKNGQQTLGRWQVFE